VPQAAVPQTWDIQADVVVVEFGAAGACAALEAAAAGRDVVMLDRFAGGGATALSGGVIYAGGGTSHQLAAGVRDSPEAMFSYLSLEVGGAVSPATLREFCRGSRDMLAWLERRYGRPRLAYPAPMLTLGGLMVTEETGVPGLYAAGRSAAGLCSRSYVSGLSLADRVFSGRRAGRHAAAAVLVASAGGSEPAADQRR
jgi:succinate dehydrogenase/fumarate reductase flavoprotein subunit